MRRLLERLDAGLNPLMVKEVQQGLRNRALIGMAVFVLGIPLLSTLGLMGRTSVQDDAGRTFFMPLVALLGLSCGLLVPLRAAQQYLGEVKSRTIDLTILSGLSPLRLASGRLQSAGLQVLLMIALTAPFGVASIEFGGIGASAVLTSLTALLCGGVWQCSACLLAVTATLVAPKLTPLLTLVVIGHTLFGSGLLSGVIGALFDTGMVAWGLLYACVMLGAITLLNVRLAADLLTPRGKRSYAGSKLIAAAALVLACAPPLFFDGFPFRTTPGHRDVDGYRAFLISMSVVPFCMLCAAFSASDRRRSPVRALGSLLDDGCVPSLAYGCAVLSLLCAVLYARGWPFGFVLLLGGFLVFFVGVAELLRSYFGGTAEAYYLWLVGTSIANLLMHLGHSIYRLSGTGGHAGALVAFLPGLALSEALSSTTSPTPWSLAPFAVGVLALCLRRGGRPVRAAHG